MLQLTKDIKAWLYLFRSGGLGTVVKVIRLSRRPIIIGGCGRSGTTLLLSLLSCHPNIYGIGVETRAFSPNGHNYIPDHASPFRLKKLYEYVVENENLKGAVRWCEKTPRNVLYYGRILEYYGERVRVINVVRDGRDVILSRHPTNPDKFWVTPERWFTDVTQGKQFDSHPQVLTIRYEDLVNDPDTTLKSVYDFTGESFSDELLKYPQCTKVQQNAAWFGKARPLSNSGVGRWKDPQYEERVASFTSNPKVLELLKHYGYSTGG